LRKHLVTLLGSVFYTGFFPFAPATFLCMVWLAAYLFIPGGGFLSSPISVAVMLPLALYLSHEMEKIYGKDASQIVIDEFVGMQVTMLAIEPSILKGVMGFMLFRIFDIAKPFPVGKSQKIRGGLGVVLDDVLAGIYAYGVLFILVNVFHLN